MKQYPAIYLASNSPRRRQLLQQIGVHFETLSVDIDESIRPMETPLQLVQRLAIEKAQAGWQHPLRHLDKAVLGADTLLACDEQALGKPHDFTHFCHMMHQLSGRSHHVLSAVALLQGETVLTRTSCSEVTFRTITQDEIQSYWQTGEPQDKAGGYAIQGFASIFVEQIKGSYTGIVGLPLFETAQLLEMLCRKER